MASSSSTRSRSIGGLAGVLLGATCIATAPIFAVLAHDWTGLSPLVTAMWRTSLSVPLIVFVLVWREGWRSPSWRGSSEPWWLLLPGLFFAGDLAAWHSSMTIISAGGATFLANLAAVIVPIVAWFWLSERPRRPFFFGATIAVVGAGLLLVRPDVDVMQTLPNSGSRYAWGNFLGVLTAGCYAGYQLSSRVVRRQLSTLRTMAWTTIVCSLVLVLVAWSSTDQWVPSESRGWLPLVGMALFGQVLGQGLIVWSMRLVSASVVAVALLWQPLAASLLGFLVLGQRISFVQALGMVGVLLGLATVALRGRG